MSAVSFSMVELLLVPLLLGSNPLAVFGLSE